ncbi:MAG: hypothetical protein ACI8W1_002268 [Candidatus Azotimanducaceae bacterium]
MFVFSHVPTIKLNMALRIFTVNFRLSHVALTVLSLLLILLPTKLWGIETRETAASQIAYSTLAKHLNVTETEIATIRLSRFNWPNSALGCPKPGVAYMQSIVPGYLALLKHGNKQYRVHIGNGRGLICNLATVPLKLDEIIFDSIKQKSIDDLAAKVSADTAKISVISAVNVT